MPTSPPTETCQPRLKAGDPCKSVGDCGSTESCPADPSICSNENLWCDTAAGTCKVGAGEGEPCGQQASGNVACASSFFCDQVFIDQPGVCRKAGGVGAPCNQLGCTAGLHCAGYVPTGTGATLGKCVEQSAAGGPCTSNDDSQNNQYCGSGTCGGGGAFGAACREDTDCASGLTCNSSKCAHAAYPGDACDGTTTVCVLSICRNGTCADHAKVGETCATNDDCATGTCFQGKCADTSVCPAR
jgi:hypothetical protein